MLIGAKQLAVLVKAIFKNYLRSITKLSSKAVLIEPKTREKGKVVLSYLGQKRQGFHTNTSQQDQIVEAIRELGYSVTLVENDSPPIFAVECDYLIGFGAAWRRISRQKNIKRKILLATEAPPFLSYLNEARAISEANKSGVKAATIERTYRFYYDDDYLGADAIFQMGSLNINILKMIQAFSHTKIHELSTYGLEIANSERKLLFKRDFIWFGSHGVIHKGLNVVFDAFRSMNVATIYVAGCSHSDFLIQDPPKNAIYLGILNVKSNEFKNIVDSCVAFILPSASEGISTAAITCMYKGLIPIVTAETNIDMEYAYSIDRSPESIIKTVQKIISLDESDLSEKSELVRLSALEKYSPATFKKSLTSALSKELI